MLRLNSIKFKLLGFIVGAFALTTLAVLILANIQLKRILDRNQEAFYAERIEAIVGLLARSDERLVKTGLVEVYRDDFQDSAVDALRKTYYRSPHPVVYPFILAADGAIVMHPVLATGDRSVSDHPVVRQMQPLAAGNFEGIYQKQNKWYIFERFEPWDWIVGYALPLDVKYRDAMVLRNTLAGILVGVTLCVLLVLSLLVTRFINPIIRLSDASKRIAAGDLDQQIERAGTDEVGTLARNFDEMRAAVKTKIGELNTEIRQRSQAERELDQLRNYLSNIINSMPSLLTGVDAAGTITLWNQEAERITGRPAGEAVGLPLDRAVPWLTDEMARVQEAISSRTELRDPKRSRRVGDHLIYEDITIYPLVANGVEGAVIRVDNVSERVRMEEMMIQNEKMLSVGGLAAGMAHEINNPLAGILQTASVMQNRLSAGMNIPANRRAASAAGTSMDAIGAYMKARGIHDMIATIVDSSKRVATIVANMLGFARKGEARKSSHDLAQLIDNTLALAATDYDLKKQYDFKQIEIVKEYAADLPTVPCEGAKIQQVVLNLLRNGAQAMQAHGTERPCITIRTYLDRDRRTACMALEDNGPGMDAATRKRIFEPFFTTKPVGVGTGLGLSVSYFIITENHGGEMRVDSEPGRGATFTILLPLAAEIGDPR